ncbi:MAG: glycosyltransferase family 4 protein [Chloroflexi bacterium]|nr:glycosyltransferase family 4 protein [Chloroflexota bacterium]
MLTVCLVTGEYPPLVGGISDYTAGLAAALSTRGHRVTVVTDRRVGARAGVYPAPGWGVRQLPALVRLIRQLAPTVVHIQYQAAAFALRGAIHMLPWLLRPLPSVVTFHDTREPYLFPKAGRLRRWANVMLARGCRRVIVSNLEDGATLHEYGQPRLTVVPLGPTVPVREVSPAERQATRVRLGATPDDFLIGHFGLMGATKGVETLLAAVARLPQARLVLLGAAEGASDPLNSVAARRVELAIAAAGLSERVHWSGPLPREEVPALLAACDVIALPYQDGASYRRTTLIAALANGCAVVTTEPPAGSRALAPADGLPPLRHGVELLLVPSARADALAEALALLQADPRRRAALGTAARQAGAAFAWPAVAARTEAVYCEVTGGD